MANLLVLYKKPKDPQAFDRYYAATHVGLAKKIPGLRRYEISHGAVNSLSGPAAYYLVAILSFDSAEAIENALKSPEGKATAADLANFADGGAELFVYETKSV